MSFLERILNSLRRARSIRDVIDLGGNLEIEVREAATGKLVDYRLVHNKVPLVGRNLLRDLLLLTTPGTGLGFAPTHLALGTGTTAAADGDTKLVTEVHRDIITARKPSASKAIIQYFLPAGKPVSQPVNLAEAGLFDNSVLDLGLLLGRATFTPINKTASVEVTFTWEITIAST